MEDSGSEATQTSPQIFIIGHVFEILISVHAPPGDPITSITTITRIVIPVLGRANHCRGSVSKPSENGTQSQKLPR